MWSRIHVEVNAVNALGSHRLNLLNGISDDCMRRSKVKTGRLHL